MGGPLRVGDGGGERATFARGRWTLRLGSVFCEAGVDARARQTSEYPAEVGGWASKGEMEGGKGRELCPGERTVVVKIMVLPTYSLETRRNTMSSPPFLEGGRNYGHPRTTAAQRVCRLVAREIR